MRGSRQWAILLAFAPAFAGCHRGQAPAMSQASPQRDDSAAVRPLATRQELESLRRQLEQPGGSRADAAELALVRQRLEAGDFRPGDQVILDVQGDSTLTDTFAVWPDRQLHLPSPAVGGLSLQGVLRSELDDKVARFIARFVRNPVVRARPTLRMSVQGQVVHAGYHAVPADAMLSDALTAAGGTTSDANMSKAKLERGGHTVMDSRALERALADGRTLDQAGIREGDEIIVPRRPMGPAESLQMVWLVMSIGLGAYTLSKVL